MKRERERESFAHGSTESTRGRVGRVGLVD